MQFDPGMEYRPDPHGGMMRRPNPVGGHTPQGPTRGMGAAGARLGSGLPPPIIPVGSTVGVGSTGGPGNPGPGGKPTNTAPLGTGQLPSKDDKS